MKRLIVYLHGESVGTLDQDDSGLIEFRYGSEWLNRANRIPLSRSLPLQGEPFRGRHIRAFFAGVLPDEGPREQVAAVLGISAKNDFAMLERIGGECAGAVSLLPEGAPAPQRGAMRTIELNEEELAAVVAELPRRPLLAGREGVRLSLAGSQLKLPVVLTASGAVALPLGDTPSTHILKPEPDRFPGLVANELFCMKLARAAGLRVPEIFVRTTGDRRCLVVARYDRVEDAAGTVTRVHQEDFCQALGLPPERKYQEEGGPLLRDCVNLLREWSTVPVLDIRDFLDGLTFNAVIGNADAHGKNYSMLYFQGDRRLAPFYDLVCTLAWPELSKVPAMKIGKSESIETITPAHWQRMARECGVGWPMLRERMVRLCARVVSGVTDAEAHCAAVDAAEACRLAETVGNRAKALFQSLKEGW